jgi:hypothetical protein
MFVCTHTHLIDPTTGTVDITLLVVQSTSTLTFHSFELQYTSVSVKTPSAV